MTRYKMLNNEKVQMSSAEEAEVDTFQQAHIDAQPAAYMANLRRQRDALLVETDYMGNSDVTMSAKWKTYRQALRDVTSQTPNNLGLSNITFPTKPS